MRGLTVNGRAWNKAYLDYSDLARGANLDFDLSASPDPSWASGARPRPRPDPTGARQVLTCAGPASGLILAPGTSGGTSSPSTT